MLNLGKDSPFKFNEKRTIDYNTVKAEEILRGFKLICLNLTTI